MGSHVSRTARIEPVTPAGEVYVTEQFAAALVLDGRGRSSSGTMSATSPRQRVTAICACIGSGAAPGLARQPILDPTSASWSGRSSTTPSSLSRAPSTSTSDMNGPIWRGGKLTTATTSVPSSSSTPVGGDLRGGALDPELRSEVDRELPGRLLRLRELVDGHHAPDAHVDLEEVVEVDLVQDDRMVRIRSAPENQGS